MTDSPVLFLVHTNAYMHAHASEISSSITFIENFFLRGKTGLSKRNGSNTLGRFSFKQKKSLRACVVEVMSYRATDAISFRKLERLISIETGDICICIKKMDCQKLNIFELLI